MTKSEIAQFVEAETKRLAWMTGIERPRWIDDAFAASIEVVNRKLCRGKLSHWARVRPSKEGQAVCFCCGEPTLVLFEAYGRGALARLAHHDKLRRVFQQFAADCPFPMAYTKMFMQAMVPANNKILLSRRWCLECGTPFELTTPDEVRMARHCSRCATREQRAA